MRCSDDADLGWAVGSTWPAAGADPGLHRLRDAGGPEDAAHGQGNTWLAALAVLVAALPMPIVQSVGYPTYAEQFPTWVRSNCMAIAGVLDNYQQPTLVIVPQVKAYAPLLFDCAIPRPVRSSP